MNYFIEIEGSTGERKLFDYLKQEISADFQMIKPGDYRQGSLFFVAQVDVEIKGKPHRLNTGIRLGKILKPSKAVIFYHKRALAPQGKPYLVDLDDRFHLKENILKALSYDGEILWRQLGQSFPETFFMTPHDDRGLKKMWESTAMPEPEPPTVMDEPKEILIVDDEYRYFKHELETVCKRRFPSWEILWAEDEAEADKLIAENYHLDLVMLDLEFRGDDIEGKELLQKLQEGKEKHFFFPILVFSRCRDLDIIEELLKPMAKGADDYISKFDILEKDNYNLLVTIMARHMNRYDQVHDMQKILAPDVDHQTSRFHILGKSKPFAEVGGDVIDFIRNDEQLTVFLADAISHGFDAGLLSGMFKASLKTKLLEPAPLLETVEVVDTVLCRIKKKSQKRLGFVLTAVLIRFDQSNRAEIVNAGHLPVLLYHSRTGHMEEISLKKHDRALGMIEKGNPRQRAFVEFENEDLFVLFSDGISETKGRNEEDFDIHGLKRIIAKYHKEPLSLICEKIFESVRKHGRQSDDRTLMLIRSRRDTLQEKTGYRAK